FRDAAQWSVSLESLQVAASGRIADITGSQAGLVTAGAAAGLTLGTAAILTGLDPGRMERLPHCQGMRSEILIAREQRSGYDHAIRAAGARLVEVGFNEIASNAGVRRTEAWEYEVAINEQTAGIAYGLSTHSQPALEELVEVAHRHRLPVLVDAAGELPPRKNLKTIIATGADLVSFSGGKAIRGPQSTGILCGRRDLIAAAALQMLDMDDHQELWEPAREWFADGEVPRMPRHGVGRGLKVSKEEIVALLTALELFASGHYEEDAARCRSELEQLTTQLEGSRLRTVLVDRDDQGRHPILEVHLPKRSGGPTAMQVCRALRQGQPAIYVGHGRLSDGILAVDPLCFHDGDGLKVAVRLIETLDEMTSVR
ncbi:MAG: aminotransferase class V-fold PLP-dependent enzyme, partial [Planctomycetaceae bacterium]